MGTSLGPYKPHSNTLLMLSKVDFESDNQMLKRVEDEEPSDNQKDRVMGN